MNAPKKYEVEQFTLGQAVGPASENTEETQTVGLDNEDRLLKAIDINHNKFERELSGNLTKEGYF